MILCIYIYINLYIYIYTYTLYRWYNLIPLNDSINDDNKNAYLLETRYSIQLWTNWVWLRLLEWAGCSYWYDLPSLRFVWCHQQRLEIWLRPNYIEWLPSKQHARFRSNLDPNPTSSPKITWDTHVDGTNPWKRVFQNWKLNLAFLTFRRLPGRQPLRVAPPRFCRILRSPAWRRVSWQSSEP